MKHAGRWKAAAAALGMLLLILDSRTALQGAREGIELCLRTVVPSLFPFFVLSGLLTSSLLGRDLPLLRPLERLTGIRSGTGSILLAGLLGGYPIGARSVADARRRGQLSAEESGRMMAFCNNAGPSFLFGIAGAMFPQAWVGWALWGIHVVSALAVGALLPGKTDGKVSAERSGSLSLPAAVTSAIGAMAGVCGWVVLFRVVLAFLDHWCLWLLSAEGRVAVCGLLELTNGCCALGEIENLGARFVICSGLLAFGGLCVTMQTVSVAQGVGLRWYLPGKLLQTGISIGLALAVQSLFPGGSRLAVPPMIPLGLLVLPGVGLFFRGKRKNRGGIPVRLGV